MKTLLPFLAIAFFLSGCSGPGGPGQRAGAAVDNAVYNVGHGVKKAGQSIENAAQ